MLTNEEKKMIVCEWRELLKKGEVKNRITFLLASKYGVTRPTIERIYINALPELERKAMERKKVSKEIKKEILKNYNKNVFTTFMTYYIVNNSIPFCIEMVQEKFHLSETHILKIVRKFDERFKRNSKVSL